MTAEPAPGYRLSRGATLLAFSGVMLGLLLASLNQTILTTAAPRILSDLGGLTHYSWIFTAYMLTSAVTVPVWSGLSDAYGRRPFFAAGILIFLAGSLIGATAGSMGQLVLARAVQGVGAGALIPLSMAVVGDLVPPAERGRWQGLVGLVFGVASVLGPTAGGLIVDHTSWRWVFIPSLPLGAVAFAVSWATLRIPPHPGASRRIDYAGAALFTCGASAVLLALIAAGESGGSPSAPIVALAVGGVLVLGLFARHERRVADPIVPIRLFRHRGYGAANVAAFMIGVATFATLMFVPLFAQGAIGDSATSSGIVVTPLVVSMIVSSVLSGQLIARLGRYRWALVTGPPLMLAGFLLLLGLDTGSEGADVVHAMVVMGIGLGLLFQNLVLVVQNGVPPRHIGAATGAAHFSRVMGGAVGVTVLGAVLTARLADRGLSGAVGGSLLAPGAGTPPLAVREDVAAAVHPIFLAGLPVVALAWAATLLIPELAPSEPVKAVELEPAAALDPRGA